MQAYQAIPERQIRAVFDDRTVRVYQAYSHEIADAALSAGRFVAPFKVERMTWIKPSFLWMMYRAGWGFKDAGQARILAIDIRRDGFDWALAQAHTTSHETVDAAVRAARDDSPVLVQWDPERDIHLNRLEYRSLQMGLRREAVRLYVHEWTTQITDVTDVAHSVHGLLGKGLVGEAKALLPVERPYVSERT